MEKLRPDKHKTRTKYTRLLVCLTLHTAVQCQLYTSNNTWPRLTNTDRATRRPVKQKRLIVWKPLREGPPLLSPRWIPPPLCLVSHKKTKHAFCYSLPPFPPRSSNTPPLSVVQFQEALVAKELLRPNAQHAHRNRRNALSPPAVLVVGAVMNQKIFEVRRGEHLHGGGIKERG